MATFKTVILVCIGKGYDQVLAVIPQQNSWGLGNFFVRSVIFGGYDASNEKKLDMAVPLSIFLPVVGGVYGAMVGAYFHGKNKSPKRKAALQIAGVVLVVVCIVAVAIDLSR